MVPKHIVTSIVLKAVANDRRKVAPCLDEFYGPRFDAIDWVASVIKLRSELSDLSDDNNAANKTYESRILEEESSSDESDEEKYGNIGNGKTIFDHSLP
ncbi:hypothetical protein TNCV_3133791 [Trichonephila clavipes]|nr:hypothetical protein TNCV_3133791 [Trichonephila clavipes]